MGRGEKKLLKLWRQMGRILQRGGQVIMTVALPFLFFSSNGLAGSGDVADDIRETSESSGSVPAENLGHDFFTHPDLKKVVPAKAYKDGLKLSEAFGYFDDQQYENCLKTLEAISTDSVFSDYRLYLMAACHLKKGEAAKTVELLNNLSASPQSKIAWETYWLKLEAWADLKRVDLVRPAVAEILKKSPSNKLKQARSAYILGKACLVAGQKQSALTEFGKVVLNHVGTEYDDRIFSLLKDHGLDAQDAFTEAQWNMRALKLIDSGYAYRATALYQNLMRQHGGRSDYQGRLAYSVFRERRYALAAQMFEKILHDGISSTDRLQILVRLAQSYARQDDFDDALRVNNQIIAEYPNTSSASEARKKINFLYFDSGQYDKALEFYQKSTAPDAHFYRFWSCYLDGKYPAALQELNNWHSSSRKKGNEAQLNYWLGRVHEKLGKNIEAHEYYQKTALIAGDTYYGLLSRQRLGTGRLFPWTMANPELLQALPRAGDYRDGLPVERELSNLALIRGAMLYAMGQDLFAYNESQMFLASRRGGLNMEDVGAVGLSGGFYTAFGLYKSALSGSVAGCDGLACAWAMGYPKAYQKYISSFANHWGIPEDLAYSVMRQESVFKPEAFSYAYANGLMQIIPPTGDEIAGKIRYPGFHPGQLTDPRLNTLFGTYYLSYLLKTFNNELVYAIAGYNAGPDAVGRWVKRYQQLEMDEFVELIPYDQTKDYVRKVLVNFLVYDHLYR